MSSARHGTPTSPAGTLTALIGEHAERSPDACAIAAPQRPPLSYAALAQQMSATSQALAAAGLGRGCRVGIALPHGPEMAVALLSVMSCATAVPINPDLDDATLRHLCQRLRVDALIVAADAAPGLAAVARELALIVLSLDFSPADPAGTHALPCHSRATAIECSAAEPDDIGLVLHTSGTTGRPKVVPLTQRSQLDEALRRIPLFQLTSSDCAICVAPLFTASALRRSLFPVLAAGGRVVCPPSFDGERLYDWLAMFEPTFYAAGPAVHASLLEAISRRGRRPAHALRYVTSGTTALGDDLQARFEQALGVPLIQTYAMTETGSIAQNPLPPGIRRAGSVGVTTVGHVAIVDDHGGPVDAGRPGEIVVRGPQVFAGYEDDPKANADAFFGEWFRTGDIGHLDSDGYLFITGRLKEVINRGGFKVSPAEVDAALMRHPAVADAATFGIAHASLGEDVIAVVVLRSGTDASAQDLRDFAFANVADFKVPSRIELVSAIPKTPLGKVRRRELFSALALSTRAAYAAPRDDWERAVASLFGEVLDVDTVGIGDNFFALGGDSLRSARVATRIGALFDCVIDGAVLFRRPTVAELAAEIRHVTRDEARRVAPPIVPLPRSAQP